MAAKLYIVNGSHPCAAVAKALEMKGIAYKTVELMPPMHFALQRIRFGKRTVPGLTLDGGEKVHGSRAIMHRLDELQPEPPLYGDDPRIEDADRWGDEVLQPVARQLIWPLLKRNARAIPSYQEGSKLPVPGFMAIASAPLISRVEIRMNDAGPSMFDAALASLPGHVDRVDAWIEDGVLGGETPNAADLQIASSLRLILTIEDLVRFVDGRPAGELARRVFATWPGHMPAGAIPADRLPQPQPA